MAKKFLDSVGLGHLWSKIKSTFATKTEVKNDHYTKLEVDRIQQGNVNALNNKMNNGIIQTYRGQEVSFKTENNQNNIVFNYRSEQSTPITTFAFHAGKADGTKANIICRDIDCYNIDAASQLKFNGNEANIVLKNSQAEYPLIKFKASTTDIYGHGVLIGGGGSVVIGAGESANAVFNSVVPNPDDESVRISADEIICFYPGQQNGFSDKNTYINTNGEYIMNNKKVATEESLDNYVFINKSSDTMLFSKTDATDELNILKRVDLQSGIGFTVYNKSSGWKEYRLPQQPGTFAMEEKVYKKDDLVFSLSGTTLTITKK